MDTGWTGLWTNCYPVGENAYREKSRAHNLRKVKVVDEDAVVFDKEVIDHWKKLLADKNWKRLLDSLLFEIDARWKSTLENLVQATGESDTYSIDTYKELDFLIKQKSFMLAIRDSVGIILDLSETHEGHYPDGDEAINEIYRNLTQLS